MSAILGVFGAAETLPSDLAVRAMLGRMSSRGDDLVALWRGDGAVLAVSRHEWESAAGCAGDALVVEADGLVVVADATLYYQGELRQKLAAAGVPVRGSTPSHLVLAAYRTWGMRCTDVLEGDFAFLVYDPARRTACAGRDFAGRRPLYYMEQGGALVVGSAVSAVTAFPGYRETLDLRALGSVAAGLLGASRATAFEGVNTLQAGEALTRNWVGQVTVASTWDPPIFESGSQLSFEEAAERLRELLSRATEERLAFEGPTSVWMSGGWDSSAVFGAGEEVLRRRGRGEHLEIVSISYPPGDPGREDELILDIARHWNRPVNWIDIQEIPFFDRLAERAAEREQPIAHVYETWNRALMARSRAAGARVALDGFGGDGLFQVSPVYLADLLTAGRWPTLANEWKAKRLQRSWRNAYTFVARPLLPRTVLDGAAILRKGKRLRGDIEPALPDWINPAFARRHDLPELTRSPVVRRPGESASARETQWHLRTPWVPTLLSCLSDMGLQNGVEIRSPLYDRRVIEFAATRPRDERSAGGETKRLLRASMRGLLPDNVLAPRTSRTGMTTGYFARSMRQGLAAELLSTFEEEGKLEPGILAELGVIDFKKFWASAGRYLRGTDTSTGVDLLMTLQTELWLRTHGGNAAASAPAPATHAVAVVD